MNVRTRWKEDIGKKFNMLLVLERIENYKKHNHVRYKCLCDCGNITETYANSVRRGTAKSCGCLATGSKRDGKSPYRKIVNAYKNGAKTRGLSFNLSFEQVVEIINKNCFYCGDPPSRVQFAFHRTRKTKGIDSDESVIVNGIDRVDSNEGYELFNCVPCCRKCNTIKLDMSVEEFKLQIEKIYNHLMLRYE